MKTKLLNTFTWIGGLSGSFIKGAPIETVSVVALTLVSQILTIFAFLLPLKVIMLLGAKGTPRFLPESLAHVDKHSLVLSLGGLAILCFVANIFVIKWIDHVSASGAIKLNKKTEKLSLFENQKEIASKAYLKYAESLASFVFTLLAVTLLFFLYQPLAVFLLCYLAAASVLFLLLMLLSVEVKNDYKKALVSYLGQLSNVGFLAAFVFVVINFLYFDPPAFFIAMLSLILTRRILGLMRGGINAYLWLLKKKHKIESLFFKHRVFNQVVFKESSLWQLIQESKSAEGWLAKILRDELNEHDFQQYKFIWRQVRLKNIYLIELCSTTSGKAFLVKLFDRHKTLQARHERAFYDAWNDTLPSIPLIHSCIVGEHYCNIFDGRDTKPYEGNVNDSDKKYLFSELLRFPPPATLTQKYKRSKVALPGRISIEMFDKLALIGDLSHQQIINDLIRQFDVIKSLLRVVPLAIWIPIEASLLRKNEERVLIADWTKWRLEPIGYRCGVTNEALDTLQIELTQLGYNRKNIHSCSLEHYQLVAYISELECMYSYEQFNDALDLIINISTCLHTINNQKDGSI
jgi:succinate dehydrogenase/fumarate reductase cytochrome b subunit